MEYEVIRTDTADAGIRKIILYIAQNFGNEVALEQLDYIEKKILELGNDPYIGTDPRYLVLKRQGYKVLILKKNLFFYKINEEILKKISDVQTAQGILATVYMPKPQLDLEKLASQNGLILVLETIQDPGNLGTLIRTAVATGVQAIVLVENCADLYAPKVVRGSMGGIFRVPIIGMSRLEVLERLKASNYKILVTSLEAAQNVYEIELPVRMALVLGNEANGVSEVFLQASDLKIVLPQLGKIESLNVAIAGSVLMYEYLRQNK